MIVIIIAFLILIINTLVATFNHTYTTVYNKIVYITYMFSAIYIIIYSYYVELDLLSKILLLLVVSIVFIVLTILNTQIRYFFYNSVILYSFVVITFIIVHTNSILHIFIMYELMMLPSIALIYTTSYARRSLSNIIYFIMWTQGGSLLLFFFFIYIFTIYGTQFFLLKHTAFNLPQNYNKFLQYALLIGVGVKLPLFPFYRWLIHIHVESSSGFSIFLSGFLVKIAVWMYYKIAINLAIFNIHHFQILAILGTIAASIQFWIQTDLKCIIAYATVQEMGMLFFLLSSLDQKIMYIAVVFTIAHGFMSALMFYTIELIYRRYKTRNYNNIAGLWYSTPALGLLVLIKLLLFISIPGGIKFTIEYAFFSNCFSHGFLFGSYMFIVIGIIGTIGYARIWFKVLFSPASYKTEISDMSIHETIIGYYLILANIIINCFFVL